MSSLIIQCAAGKKDGAPGLALNGERIRFVAQPAGMVNGEAAPWDLIPGSNRTWIDCVRDYNALGMLDDRDEEVGVSIIGVRNYGVRARCTRMRLMERL